MKGLRCRIFGHRWSTGDDPWQRRCRHCRRAEKATVTDEEGTVWKAMAYLAPRRWPSYDVNDPVMSDVVETQTPWGGYALNDWLRKLDRPRSEGEVPPWMQG